MYLSLITFCFFFFKKRKPCYWYVSSLCHHYQGVALVIFLLLAGREHNFCPTRFFRSPTKGCLRHVLPLKFLVGNERIIGDIFRSPCYRGLTRSCLSLFFRIHFFPGFSCRFHFFVTLCVPTWFKQATNLNALFHSTCDSHFFFTRFSIVQCMNYKLLVFPCICALMCVSIYVRLSICYE